MNILQTKRFSKFVKKLHSNQKKDLDKAVREIISNPYIGEKKKGDLSGILVYKFKMTNQLSLLAYSYESETITLTLLSIGVHENFYRDLKKQKYL